MASGHLMTPVAPKGRPGSSRTKLSVNLDNDLLRWAESNSGPGKRFDSVRHAIEVALADLRQRKP